MTQELNWKRITIDTLAIAGSILLAFAIDVWWEERDETLRLRGALENVVEEVARDRLEIIRAVQRNRSLIDGQVQFLSMTPEELQTGQDLIAISRGFDHPSSFDSAGISLQGLLVGGNLELVSGGELAGALLEWAQLPAEIESDYLEASQMSMLVAELAAPYGLHLMTLNQARFMIKRWRNRQ